MMDRHAVGTVRPTVADRQVSGARQVSAGVQVRIRRGHDHAGVLSEQSDRREVLVSQRDFDTFLEGQRVDRALRLYYVAWFFVENVEVRNDNVTHNASVIIV